MSPLPETERQADFFFQSEDNIKNFFYGNITPDESRSWHVYHKDSEEEFARLKDMRVNFSYFFERYTTKSPEGKTIYHSVFGAYQPGVFVELTSDEPLSLGNVKKVIKNSSEMTYHRLGERASSEYIASTLSG